MARSRATTTYDDEDAEMEVVVIFVSFQIVYGFLDLFIWPVLVFFSSLPFSLQSVLVNFLLARSSHSPHKPAVPTYQGLHHYHLGRK